MAQSGSVLVWGARGRKFESCRPDKKKNGCLFGSVFLFPSINRRSFSAKAAALAFTLTLKLQFVCVFCQYDFVINVLS